MTGSNGEKHPFLDDLADDAELTGTVLRRPVSGPDNIKRLVGAVGTLYASQTPTFYGAIDQRHYLQYKATLRAGLDLDAVGVINAVPEPGSWILLAMGSLGVAWMKARKRRQNAKTVRTTSLRSTIGT